MKDVQHLKKKTRKQKQGVEEKILTRTEFGKLSFEEKLYELAKFKEVHGHCNVSKHTCTTKQTSLAWWVYRLRQTMQGGKRGYKDFKLTPANIAKLDELGFQWKDNVKTFEEHLHDLKEYKAKHGHCKVPYSYKHTSLAWWVYRLRQTRQGGKNGYKDFKLTPANIAKLDELGFQWKTKTSKTFEEHLHDLKEYKALYGDCNVPYQYEDNKQLGIWCRSMNFNYQLIQQGKKPRLQLSQEKIDKLDSMGFSWKGSSKFRTFEEHLSDLKEFKRKHGHCNVKYRYKENPKLAEWCFGIRKAYKYFVAGKKSKSYNLTPSMVEQLEQLGFRFVTSADEYILHLQMFKNEHGHCDVPKGYKDNQKLGAWIVNMRAAYRSIKAGKKPRYSLTPSMINQLNDMGFSWQGKR